MKNRKAKIVLKSFYHMMKSIILMLVYFVIVCLCIGIFLIIPLLNIDEVDYLMMLLIITTEVVGVPIFGIIFHNVKKAVINIIDGQT